MSATLFAVILLPWNVFPQSQVENPGVLRIRYATIVVPNYDEALRWYTEVFGLEKVEEGSFGPGPNGSTAATGLLRWIVVAPHGQKDFGIVLELAQPTSPDDKIREMAR